MPMKSLACACAFATSLGAWATAAAKTRVASAAVASDRELDAEAVAAGVALRRLLESDPAREPVDLGALAEGEARSRKAKKAGELLARALEQLDRLQDQAAMASTGEAIESLEDGDLTRDFGLLLDIFAVRALALYTGGNKAAMRDELAKLYALKADYELDRDRTPPDVPPEVAAARAQVSRAPRAMLEVSSEPVPAEVFVDGVFRGVGAVAVRDLAPGRHYVALRALGYELAQQAVVAAPGSAAAIRLTLRPAAEERGLLDLMEGLRKSSPQGAAGGGAALARWASASEVLVVALRRSGKGLWARASLLAADGAPLAAAEGALGTPEETAELVRALLWGGGAPRESPRPRRTLPYALWGGGALAAAAGAVLGALAQKDYEKAKGLQWDPDKAVFDRAKAAAVRERMLANIGFGIGAAAAGVGLFFAIKGDAPSPKKEAHLAFEPFRGGGGLVVAGGF
jgi:hypothetical protein